MNPCFPFMPFEEPIDLLEFSKVCTRAWPNQSLLSVFSGTVVCCTSPVTSNIHFSCMLSTTAHYSNWVYNVPTRYCWVCLLAWDCSISLFLLQLKCSPHVSHENDIDIISLYYNDKDSSGNSIFEKIFSHVWLVLNIVCLRGGGQGSNNWKELYLSSTGKRRTSVIFLWKDKFNLKTKLDSFQQREQEPITFPFYSRDKGSGGQDCRAEHRALG